MIPPTYEIFISSFDKILERIIPKNNEPPPEIVLNDKFGHTYNGHPTHLDLESRIVVLYSKENILTYVLIENIASIGLADAKNKLHILEKNNKKVNITTQNFDSQSSLDEKIKVIEEAINKNIGINIKLITPILEKPENIITENLLSLIDSTFHSLMEIAKDEFGKDLISKVDAFEFIDVNTNIISLSKYNNTIVLKYCLSKNLPNDYNSLIRKKLEKTL